MVNNNIIEIFGIDKKEDIFILDVFFSDCCNFNCIYCYNSRPRSYKNINTDALLKWIVSFKKIYKIKKLYIMLIGGEPTLHPDILTFIQRISIIEDIFISIFSNFSANIDMYKQFLQYKNVDIKLTWHGSMSCNVFYSKLLALITYHKKISIKVMFEKNNEYNSINLINKLITSQFSNIEFSLIKTEDGNLQYDSNLYEKFKKITSMLTNTNLILAKKYDNSIISLNDNFFQDNLIENTNFFRWLCNAGKTYLYIDINGNIIACPEGNYNIIGSIKDIYQHIKLNQTICKSSICSCTYFITKKKIFKS